MKFWVIKNGEVWINTVQIDYTCIYLFNLHNKTNKSLLKKKLAKFFTRYLIRVQSSSL